MAARVDEDNHAVGIDGTLLHYGVRTHRSHVGPTDVVDRHVVKPSDCQPGQVGVHHHLVRRFQPQDRGLAHVDDEQTTVGKEPEATAPHAVGELNNDLCAARLVHRQHPVGELSENQSLPSRHRGL